MWLSFFSRQLTSKYIVNQSLIFVTKPLHNQEFNNSLIFNQQFEVMFI